MIPLLLTLAAVHVPAAGCTLQIPARPAIVQVVGPGARDFCDLEGRLLADRLHLGVAVLAGQWHDRRLPVSCRLRFRQTSWRLTISGATDLCLFYRHQGWTHLNAKIDGPVTPPGLAE